MSAWWGDDRHILVGALASLSFTQNYVSAHVSVPYYDHIWSLSVEEHCYVRAGSVLLPFALHGVAEQRWFRDRLARLPWLAPVAFAAGSALSAWSPWRYTAGTAALALAVVTIDSAPAAARRWLSAPILVWVGAASF